MSGLVGPDGRPLSVKDATKIAQKNAEQQALKQAELKLEASRWEIFASADSEDVALESIQGKALLDQGFEPHTIRCLYNAISMATEGIPSETPEDQRTMAVMQVAQFMIGVAIGHPSVVGRLEFVGTLAALEAGLITRKMGNEAQETPKSVVGELVT